MCLTPKIILSPLWKRMSPYASKIYIDNVEVPHLLHCTHYDTLRNFSNNLCNLTYNSDGLCLSTPSQVRTALDKCYALVGEMRIPLFFAAPCTRCDECRFDRRHQLAKRALFEASDYPFMYFFTLTYDDRHLPPEGLRPADLPPAFKRLRIQCDRLLNITNIIGNRSPIKLRIFYCGEYGTDERYTQRAHYHGIIYFSRSLTPFEELRFRHIFFHSESLFQDTDIQNFWPNGYRRDLKKCRNPFACANYITKYLTKQYLNAVPPGKTPPFYRGPSRNGGYGCSHIERYADNILKSPDFTIRLTCNYSKYTRTSIPKYMMRKIFNTDLSRLLPGNSLAFNFVKIAHVAILESAYPLSSSENQLICQFYNDFRHCANSFSKSTRQWLNFFNNICKYTGPGELLDIIFHTISYFYETPLFPTFDEYMARLDFKAKQMNKINCSHDISYSKANKQYIHEQYTLFTPEPANHIM